MVGKSDIQLDAKCFCLAVLRARTTHAFNLGRTGAKGGQNASSPTNMAIKLPFVACSNTLSHGICLPVENTAKPTLYERVFL